MAGLEVTALRKTYLSGAATFFHKGSARTDAQGRFRIEGVPPGEYVLSLETRPVILFGEPAPEGESRPAAMGIGGVYWPSLRNDAEEWTTQHVSGGGEVDLGRIRIPPAKLHRVRVNAITSGCTGSDQVEGTQVQHRGRRNAFHRSTSNSLIVR